MVWLLYNIYIEQMKQVNQNYSKNVYTDSKKRLSKKKIVPYRKRNEKGSFVYAFCISSVCIMCRKTLVNK
jgi:hypothetical protein